MTIQIYWRIYGYFNETDTDQTFFGKKVINKYLKGDKETQLASKFKLKGKEMGRFAAQWFWN